MTRQMPVAPLGTVLQLRSKFVLIDDLIEYKRCRVQLHAHGVVLRDIVAGAEIKTKKQQVCRAGDFLVAEIDAKVGGFGMVPPDLDGAIVSSHYFLFEIDDNRIDRRFLEWFTKTPAFQQQINAQGSTNYAAVRPAHVLSYLVPLPSLERQREIVAKVGAVAERVHEAEELRRQSRSAATALSRALLADTRFGPLVPTAMHCLMRLRPPDVTVQSDDVYAFAGVYSFGRGVFRGPIKKGSEFSYTKLTRLHKDDFVYPKLMAWEGALGVVPSECNGLAVSTEFPVFEVDTSRVLPEVLHVYFGMPEVWPALAGASTGTNVRRRRLHPSAFLEHVLPLPPIAAQRRLRDVLCKLDALSTQWNGSDEAMAAMVPSLLRHIFGPG